MVTSPNPPGALYEKAVAAQQAGRHDEALAIAESIVDAGPCAWQVYSLKAEALWSLGRFEDALLGFDTVVSLAPQDAEGHFGRGTTLQSLRRYQDALQAYDRTLMLNPNHVRALHNRSMILGELGQLEQAIKGYDRVIALEPAGFEAHLAKAMCLLSMGKLEDAWPEWEWRVRKFGPVGPVPRDAVLWRGEGLAGKTLFLQAEQGFGDTIQFCRYALVARKMGANVILQTHARLVRLLRGLEGVTVVPPSAALPVCDYRLMLMSMPGRLRTSLANIPVFPAYITPEQDLVETWASRVGNTGFRIGVSWQGGVFLGQDKTADTGRSFPLVLLAGIAAIADVRLISLQKDRGVEQLATLTSGMRVESLGDDFDAGPDGFCDCAAVMKNLDLVITSDTAVAHLAGALGVPVWLALKKMPDWRWLLDRPDSVWYPSMRIFRQPAEGDWAAVFDAMREKLTARGSA